jgi:hypothetical protein
MSESKTEKYICEKRSTIKHSDCVWRGEKGYKKHHHSTARYNQNTIAHITNQVERKKCWKHKTSDLTDLSLIYCELALLHESSLASSSGPLINSSLKPLEHMTTSNESSSLMCNTCIILCIYRTQMKGFSNEQSSLQALPPKDSSFSLLDCKSVFCFRCVDVNWMLGSLGMDQNGGLTPLPPPLQPPKLSPGSW